MSTNPPPAKAPTAPEAQQTRRLEELAGPHGVKVVTDPKTLFGDFWPEEESTEEFLAWLRRTRQEGDHPESPP